MNRTPSSGQRRTSVPTVNHSKLNHMQIKEQEALNKERMKQDEYLSQKQQQQMTKQRERFSHLTSQYAKENLDALGPTPSSTNKDDVEICVFVRECEPDGNAWKMLESDLIKAANAKKDKPTSAGPTILPKIDTVKGGAPLATPQLNNRAPRTTAVGAVPKYLQDRKAEMAAEKAEQQRLVDEMAEKSKYPPGHRPMSETERQVILAKLAQRMKDLEAEHGRLPMRFDTQAVQQKRKQIENEMSEIEIAVAKFSVKKQLFVPIDS